MNKIVPVLLLFLAGCGSSPPPQEMPDTGKSRAIPAAFYGDWVIKPYFDALGMEGFTGSLNTSTYGITEIVIGRNGPDSVWLNSEDAYGERVPVLFLDSCTLQLRMTRKTNTLLKFDAARDLLLFRMDDSLPQYEFSRVTDSLVSREADVSSFRKKVNCFLSLHRYTAYDPLLDAPHGVTCSFGCDGQVRGIKKFTKYRIHFSNGNSLPGEMTRISFSNEKNGTAFGMQFYKNGIRLYHLVTISKPFESTDRYRKGELFMDLVRSAK